MVNDIDSARRYATQGVESAQSAGQFELGLALDALGQVEEAASEWAMADQHFNDSMTIHRQADHHHALARVQRHFAEALLRMGEKDQALELLQAALTIFQNLNLPYEIAETERIQQSIQTAP